MKRSVALVMAALVASSPCGAELPTQGPQYQGRTLGKPDFREQDVVMCASLESALELIETLADGEDALVVKYDELNGRRQCNHQNVTGWYAGENYAITISDDEGAPVYEARIVGIHVQTQNPTIVGHAYLLTYSRH